MPPIKIPLEILRHNQPAGVLVERIGDISAGIRSLLRGEPQVSVVIPAYNEEERLLKTLSSLSQSAASLSTEIIVVDNNSIDATAQLARDAGVICVHESMQGITPARNCGLDAARGKYILNADADTIYPRRWTELMIDPLMAKRAALVYGRHAFLPDDNSRGLELLTYEQLADLSRFINRRFKEEAVNVYGFNSAFRKEDALLVNGFSHPEGSNEDGWLAVKLRQQTRLPLHLQTHRDALVWTSNRRLTADGGLFSATLKRLRR